MSSDNWPALCRQNYEALAAQLIAAGYTRQRRADIYKEQFTRAGGETLVIVRALGSANWWTEQR